jgi:hypothetical protein
MADADDLSVMAKSNLSRLQTTEKLRQNITAL